MNFKNPFILCFTGLTIIAILWASVILDSLLLCFIAAVTAICLMVVSFTQHFKTKGN